MQRSPVLGTRVGYMAAALQSLHVDAFLADTEQSAQLQEVLLIKMPTQHRRHESQREHHDHVSDVRTNVSESMR